MTAKVWTPESLAELHARLTNRTEQERELSAINFNEEIAKRFRKFGNTRDADRADAIATKRMAAFVEKYETK